MHRLTFSKSLAQLLAAQTGFQVGRWRYRIGDALKPGEKSPTGLYALLDVKRGTVLRIALDPRIAEIHCDGEYRKLAIASISRNQS